MDFALSEEQQFLQQTVADLLKEHCSLEVVRQNTKDGTTKNHELYSALGELGVPGTLIPVEYGGIGLTLLDAVLIAESLGSVVAAVPYLGSMVMAPVALLNAGTDLQKNEWLPKIASGESTIGIAISEHVGARENNPIVCSNDQLSGSAMFVLDAQGADCFLVVAQNRQFFLVDANDVKVNDLQTIDKTRSIAELTFEGSPAEHLSESDNDEELLTVLNAARVTIAADTLGASQTMLNKAIEYAGERTQFNRVIGSFQAVKHMCAEMAAELEPCRSLIWYAAHAFTHIPDEARLTACHAKAHLGEVGRFVARNATEVHGGMGFTDLLGLHYWFKRVELNRQLLGTPEFVRNEAAKVQGWT